MDTPIGNVLDIFISNKLLKERVNCKKILLDPKGILHDKYYSTDIERSVLITSIESYRLLQSHNIIIEYGLLGENLLIDYNPYKLKPGTVLEIGTTLLEISQYCTICNHLSSIDPKVPQLLKNDRGIFAKVIKSGKITRDAKISLR